MEKEVMELIDLMHRQDQSLKKFKIADNDIKLLQVRDQMLDGLKYTIKIAMDFLHLKNAELYYELRLMYEKISDLYRQNAHLLAGVISCVGINDKIISIEKYMLQRQIDTTKSIRDSLEKKFKGNQTDFNNKPNSRTGSGSQPSDLASLFKDGDSDFNNEKPVLPKIHCDNNFGIAHSQDDIIQFINCVLEMGNGADMLPKEIENLALSICCNFGIRDSKWVENIIMEQISIKAQGQESHRK